MADNRSSNPRGTVFPSLGFSRMMGGLPRNPWILIAAVLLPVLVTAGVILFSNAKPGSATAEPEDTLQAVPPTATYDACAVEIVRPEVERMHALMLEFYDASALASQTPPDKLILVIPSLQEIRRRTDAVKVSECLKTLKELEVSHMNTVINTMLAFMSNADAELLVEGVVQARLLNEEYRKEKARLLGEQYIPPPTQAYTPTAGETAAEQPTATP